MASGIFKQVAEASPGLSMKLRQAGIMMQPAEFVKKTALTAFYMATGILLVILAFIAQLSASGKIMFFIFPVLFVLVFFYFLKAPDIIILRKEKEIEREIVFAGRFLVIEMKSGVPLYDAIAHVAKNYETTGKYFKEIVDRVDIGTPLEDAIAEQIELTPSSNFRKLLWQVINSLKTGADISTSINATVDQIAKEQMIEVREYGRKLNPLAMFYLIIAIIMPSIGVVMLIIMSSFLNLQIDLAALMVLAFGMAIVQFFFLTIIKGQRPAVDI